MKNSKKPIFKNRFQITALAGIGILALAILLTVSLNQNQTQYKQQAATQLQFTHSFGAFSIGGATSVATSLGITADLEYGYDPGASGSKGGMKVIDDMPDEYIRQFAKDSNMSNLTSSMTTHLKAVQNNANIVAYWVLDDTNKNGSAKDALVQVTSLIHQYTPGKPSICGFTGNSRPWPTSKADNFSPQGCDMIAPYIYPQQGEAWDLSDIWPTMEAAFKARGWNISTTPLVGVPLSYGGSNGYSVPTAQQAETEAKAFCQYGATSLIWYDFGTGTNASSDTGVQQGIKAGIADCQKIWGNTSTSPGAGGPNTSGNPAQPSPSSVIPSFVCGGSQNCAGTPSPTIFGGGGGNNGGGNGGGGTLPSGTLSITPNPSNALGNNPSIPLTSVVPSSPNNNVSGIPPISGDGSQQGIIGELINLLKQILKLFENLFGGGSGGHHGHRHHHRH